MRIRAPLNIIKRLHRNESGLASVELLLASPLLFVLVVLLKQSALAMLLKNEVIVDARNAAWEQILNGTCGAPISNTTLTGVVLAETVQAPQCSTDDMQGAVFNDPKAFWTKMDAAGGAQLTGDVSQTPGPQFVTSTATGYFFPYSDRAVLGTVLIKTQENYSIGDLTYWSYDDPNLAAGYDKVLNQKTNWYLANTMFPNVFPKK